MARDKVYSENQRLTRAQKEANDKQWYKDQIDNLDRVSFSNGGAFDFGNTDTGAGVSEYRRMQVNYDLYNGIINKTDFEHVCFPFGKEIGELPVDFTNKDIVSGKIKSLQGMEMKRPWSWKVVAVNEEATTRREQEETSKLRDFVVHSLVSPIKTQIEQKYAQEAQGRELTPEEQQEVQQQIEQELKTLTPPEVKKYMQREHQDPSEVLSHQLLEYLIQKQDIKMKFNKGWKHGLISGREIFWVGIINGEPVVKVINPLMFDYDKSSDTDYIEDGEWAAYEMYMTPSEIIKYFGPELTPTQIDEIYEDYSNASSLPDNTFTFRGGTSHATSGIRVVHSEWKSLKPLKFVKGIDPRTGEAYEDMVDESYKLNTEAGDISITTEYIPTRHEGYKIGRDMYAWLREVPGQHKDLDNLYECKLSFIGAAYDNLNSEVTSLMDRMKFYQYMYNILWYRIELLTASDDGKVMLLNANLIPKSSGLDIEKWMYYFKVNKIGLMDPSEEGNKGSTNMGEAAKEIDMSLASDIAKYMNLLEYIEKRCGESVGITKQIEGQIGSDEAVRNTQQALIQSANILEPYFEIHNNVKRNVLQSLIECAKVAYSEFRPASLSYVLDDMSRELITMSGFDYDMLDNSTYGIFVSNSMKSHEALQMVQQLSHAALQNQRVELSDVIKIMRSESIQEAEELLQTAEANRIERDQSIQQQTIQSQEQQAKAARDWEREKIMLEHDNNMEEITLKGEIDLQKQTILSVGFNEDKDFDKDGTPDVLEVYKTGKDVEIKQAKLELDREKLTQQKVEHKDKVDLETKKIKTQQLKNKVNTK